jgi:hypothetical protein
MRVLHRLHRVPYLCDGQVFAFYILCAVVKGSIKFAGRFFLISMHPLKINGTMMNSLLFNVGLILMCSISCTQLCTTAFHGFTHSSAISQLFVSQIQYLKGLSFFYSVPPHPSAPVLRAPRNAHACASRRPRVCRLTPTRAPGRQVQVPVFYSALFCIGLLQARRPIRAGRAARAQRCATPSLSALAPSCVRCA